MTSRLMNLTEAQNAALLRLLHALVDQDRARIVVRANQDRPGFWFGGGNMVEDDDGSLWLVGRYRDYGDSRTGLGAGVRGLECALFRSRDRGATFEKVRAWSKAELSKPGAGVLSIEGTALHRLPDGSWEMFVSTEQDRAYAEPYASYQKPGTGVWAIDRMTGTTPDSLDPATLQQAVASERPEYLHVKDPVAFSDGDTTRLLFCTHPISWASSNTGMATRATASDEFQPTAWQFVERGNVWDVAATRVTDRFLVPSVGVFASVPQVAVLFYDGAESLRQLDENPRALRRPRGYSCEEIGGAMVAPADDLAAAERLSVVAPLFTSPYGTHASRYVSVLAADDGLYVTWQQARPDGSQPLVMNVLGTDEVAALLTGG